MFRHFLRLSSTVFFASILVLILFFLLDFARLADADSSILYVAPDANCGNGYTPCYGDIQDAVDAANTGDEIRVAMGTYSKINVRPRQDMITTGVVTQVVYLNKTVSIRGGYTTANWQTAFPLTQPVVLDAQGQGRVMYIFGNVSPTIEYLDIKGGTVTGLDGGGVLVITATATFRSCRIHDNVVNGDSMCGGGVSLQNSSSVFMHNSIFSNTSRSEAYGHGGGVCIEYGAPILEGNIISGNQAIHGISLAGLGGFKAIDSVNPYMILGGPKYGGGIYAANSHITLKDNVIANNSAPSNGSGLYMDNNDALLLNNNILDNGTAYQGGGAHIYGGNHNLKGNIFSGNAATYGGGLYLGSGNPTLTNNIIVGNSAKQAGGAIYIQGTNVNLMHTTIVSNTSNDSGIYVTDSPWISKSGVITLTNTILVNHSVGITVTNGSTVTINGMLWHNNGLDYAGEGVVNVAYAYTGDPAFAPDGYHITPASAALDKGVSTPISTDIDEEVRPQGIAPDLGADEIRAAALSAGMDSLVTFASPNGVVTELDIPGAAITEPVTLVYTPAVPTTSPTNFYFAGRAFDLAAYRGEILLETMNFSPAATITLHYTNADVAGLDEDQLYLYTWNTTDEIWEDAACGDYDRSPAENQLSMPICHLSQFALFGIQAAQPPTTITKYVSPEGQVQYGDELTYTLVISGAPGAEVSIYDPLTSTTFVRFIEQPDGIEYASHAITGTIVITPTNSMAISFVVQVGVPGTIGIYVDVNNTACIYPAGQTISMCEWSNTVTNSAYRPYTIFLPLVMRNQ